MIPVRFTKGTNRTVNDDLTVAPNHPITHEYCPACDIKFEVGDRVALVYIGPGASKDAQRKFRADQWHTGAAVALHHACAGSEDG